MEHVRDHSTNNTPLLGVESTLLASVFTSGAVTTHKWLNVTVANFLFKLSGNSMSMRNGERNILGVKIAMWQCTLLLLFLHQGL